jgi:hypothetical protein
MGQLRDELKPNATKERIEIVKNKIIEIEDAINHSNDVKLLIENFNELTNRDYDKEYFMTYWNSESIDDFARDAAQPVPNRIDNISKEEYVEIVERLRNADDNAKFYLDLYVSKKLWIIFEDCSTKHKSAFNLAIVIRRGA